MTVTAHAPTAIRTVGVTDQDRAVAFSVGCLGLELRTDVPVERWGGRWTEVAPPGSSTTIALVPARPGLPTGVETGIRVTSPDAAALHAALVEDGTVVAEILRWDGVPPMFMLRDPDGNRLEIVGQAGETR